MLCVTVGAVREIAEFVSIRQHTSASVAFGAVSEIANVGDVTSDNDGGECGEAKMGTI